MSQRLLITNKKPIKTFQTHFNSIRLLRLVFYKTMQQEANLSPNSRQINAYLMQSPQLLTGGFVFYIINLCAGNQANTDYGVQS